MTFLTRTRAHRAGSSPRDGGFTLIELIMVIALISIIMSFGIPMFVTQISATQATVARVEARNASSVVSQLLTQIQTLGTGATLTQTPSTGTPTSLTISNPNGTPTSVSQSVNMTPGSMLNSGANGGEADNNKINTATDYCLSVRYLSVAVYQGAQGPLSSCNNGVAISGSVAVAGTDISKFQITPVFSQVSSSPAAHLATTNCVYAPDKAVFACLEDGGATITTTSDGTTWSSVNGPSCVGTGTPTYTNGKATGLSYGNGVFLVPCAKDSKIYRSADLNTWTGVTAPAIPGQGLIDTASQSYGGMTLVYGNGVWVGVGATLTSATGVLSTDNGATWTSTTIPATTTGKYAQAIAYGNGVFVACGGSDSVAGATYNSTTKVLTWTTRTLATDATRTSAAVCSGLAYGNGTFLAAYTLGNPQYSADNAATWTKSTITNQGVSVSYGNGYFLLATPAGASRAVTTTGATQTATFTLPWTATGTPLVFGNGRWLRVDDSTNGANTTRAAIGL